MDFKVDDVVKMKKKHPCGGFEWKIRRVGMDFRIECTTCRHSVMLPRAKFEKNIDKKSLVNFK